MLRNDDGAEVIHKLDGLLQKINANSLQFNKLFL